MRKIGKVTLLLAGAVMAMSVFTGCGKEVRKETKAAKEEPYATLKKSDQSKRAEEICSWLAYGAKHYTQFQNEVMNISYCSDDLAVFSDSVGSVIYNRKKEKAIASIDLEEIGCDHFNGEGDEQDPGLETQVKVSKDEKWLIVYNLLQGKVDGKIYAYELKKEDNLKLTKIEPKKEMNENDKLYEKIMKENKNNLKEAGDLQGKIGEQIRAMDVSASKYAYQWDDSKGNKKQSVLVVDKNGLKLYTLSGKENKPNVQYEKIDLASSTTTKIDAKLPAYNYRGKDQRVKAVFDETKKIYEDENTDNIVIIPIIDVYEIEDTKDGAKVYANFWCETYYQYGNLLKNYSGGSYPGVMTLKKVGDTYKVTKKQYAEDGSSFEKSVWKLCKGHPIVAAKMLKGSISDKMKKKTLKEYIKQNNLKIKAYKEYGWQYVNL